MTKTGTSKNSLLRRITSRNNLKGWREKRNQKKLLEKQEEKILNGGDDGITDYKT